MDLIHSKHWEEQEVIFKILTVFKNSRIQILTYFLAGPDGAQPSSSENSTPMPNPWNPGQAGGAPGSDPAAAGSTTCTAANPNQAGSALFTSPGMQSLLTQMVSSCMKFFVKYQSQSKVIEVRCSLQIRIMSDRIKL